MSHIEMGGVRWPVRDTPAPTSASTEVFTAKASGVVRADSSEPVLIDAKVNGQPVTDFDVAIVSGDETPQWRPAVLAGGKPAVLTAPATKGRYRLLARRNGTVLVAGRLIRT